MQILDLEFLPDVGLEAAAPGPGVEQVASGAARQRAMGAQWPGLPLRHPHPRPQLTNTPSNSSVPFSGTVESKNADGVHPLELPAEELPSSGRTRL